MKTLTLQCAEAAAAATIWTIDPSHSTIGFSVKHMAFATVHGRFHGFSGTIRFVGDRPVGVEAEIDAATIDTGITFRDEHLRSPDFFDVATYPTISFRSTDVRPVDPRGHGRWLVVGDLTMTGVTRAVELAVEQTGGGTNPWDAETISFVATATISREAFGIGYSLLSVRDDIVIGDEVTIALNIKARKGPIGGR